MARKKEAANIIHDSCCNCRFWQRLDDSAQVPGDDVAGECRRYPPTVVHELGLVLPEVEAQFWCGEHGRTVN